VRQKCRAQRFPLVERWVGCGLRNQMRNSLVGTPSTRSVGVACEGHGAEAAPIRASRRQRPDPSGADSATRRTRATCQLPKMILVTYKSDVHPRSKVRKHGSRGRLQNGCSACRATPLARPMALPAWLTPGASGSPPVVSNLVSFTSAQERPRTAATPRCPSRRTSAGQGESWPADRLGPPSAAGAGQGCLPARRRRWRTTPPGACLRSGRARRGSRHEQRG